jgi:hypothetical protein
MMVLFSPEPSGDQEEPSQAATFLAEKIYSAKRSFKNALASEDRKRSFRSIVGIRPNQNSKSPLCPHRVNSLPSANRCDKNVHYEVKNLCGVNILGRLYKKKRIC